MFAVGFKHSYYPHQWSHGTLIQKWTARMRSGAFWAAKPALPAFLTEAAFKVLRLQNGADEGWRWSLPTG